MTHSGKGFPKELILDQLGLEKLDESTLEKKLGIELTIVKTLIKESQGELSLENLKESSGEVIGAKVRLALAGAKKEDSAELSNVKKGKKKVISVEHIHNFTIRYCKCLNCSHRYKTYESMSKEDLRLAIS